MRRTRRRLGVVLGVGVDAWSCSDFARRRWARASQRLNSVKRCTGTTKEATAMAIGVGGGQTESSRRNAQIRIPRINRQPNRIRPSLRSNDNSGR
ncbi:hypothetical protein SCHPADRAFT_118509 [Schizopora paradoxa]|uniref:Uncharacterized protein n=1 Tax=Schizopora paradoxa TaxID=27342 RepID=A0A0H2SN10_9AGAM|nr:hypothetical protein SCHPADRAFT_118509 [Schizopora paradoxa]